MDRPDFRCPGEKSLAQSIPAAFLDRDHFGSLPLRLSPHVFCFQLGQVTALYHSRRMKTLFGHEPLRRLYAFFREKGEATLECIPESFDSRADFITLLRSEFLITGDHHAGTIPAGAVNEVREPFVQQLLLLIDGNGRCSYYEFPGRHSAGRLPMSAHLARKGVELFIGCLHRSAEKATIILCSDDPAAHRETITETVRHIRKREAEGAFSGRPVTVELDAGHSVAGAWEGDFLRQQRITITLSGTPCRAEAASSGGSLKRAVAMLKDQGVRPRITLEISTDSLPFIEDRFHFCAVRLEGRKLRLKMSRGRRQSGGEVPMRVFARSMMEIFRRFRVYGLAEERAMRKVRSFVEGIPEYHDCEACGGQLVLHPSGALGVCPVMVGREGRITGSIEHRANPEEILHSPVLKRWRSRTPFLMKSCGSCPAIGLCGGGCGYAAWREERDLLSPDRGFCSFSLFLLRWLISDLAGVMGLLQDQ